MIPSGAVRTLAALAVLLVPTGCGPPRGERRPVADGSEAASTPRPAPLPDALMVRFRQTEGTGFERESWEIEVLQIGTDVRIRGSIRTGGNAVPIYRPMEASAFRELWQWLREFPLDRYQVQVDETAPEAPWTKSLEVDVVLGPDERWVSRNTWTRPLVPDDWVRGIETRLHGLVLDLAESEIDRMRAAPPVPATGGPGPGAGSLPGLPGDEGPPSSREAEEILRRAREAIGAPGDSGG